MMMPVSPNYFSIFLKFVIVYIAEVVLQDLFTSTCSHLYFYSCIEDDEKQQKVSHLTHDQKIILVDGVYDMPGPSMGTHVGTGFNPFPTG